MGFIGIALLMEVALIAEWRHIEKRHLDWENRHVTLAFLIVMASLSFVYILFSVTLLKVGPSPLLKTFTEYYLGNSKFHYIQMKFLGLKM